MSGRTKRLFLAGILAAGMIMFSMVLAPRLARAGSSGFRCPTTGRLISLGQTTFEVRNRCGEPDDRQASVEQRTVREKVRRWVDGVAGEVVVERTIEVPVEEWTYDFGRHRFIEFLRFESGRLISTGEGGRGSSDSE